MVHLTSVHCSWLHQLLLLTGSFVLLKHSACSTCFFVMLRGCILSARGLANVLQLKAHVKVITCYGVHASYKQNFEVLEKCGTKTSKPKEKKLPQNCLDTVTWNLFLNPQTCHSLAAMEGIVKNEALAVEICHLLFSEHTKQWMKKETQRWCVFPRQRAARHVRVTVLGGPSCAISFAGFLSHFWCGRLPFINTINIPQRARLKKGQKEMDAICSCTEIKPSNQQRVAALRGTQCKSSNPAYCSLCSLQDRVGE